MLTIDAPEYDQVLVSEDDRVEFIIDTGDMGKGSYFRIGVSADNASSSFWKPSDTLSAKIRSGEILPELIPIALAYYHDRGWKPQGIETATHVDGQSWTVEIKIAFEDLLQCYSVTDPEVDQEFHKYMGTFTNNPAFMALSEKEQESRALAGLQLKPDLSRDFQSLVREGLRSRLSKHKEQEMVQRLIKEAGVKIYLTEPEAPVYSGSLEEYPALGRCLTVKKRYLSMSVLTRNMSLATSPAL
jgi:hypothetical protein